MLFWLIRSATSLFSLLPISLAAPDLEIATSLLPCCLYSPLFYRETLCCWTWPPLPLPWVIPIYTLHEERDIILLQAKRHLDDDDSNPSIFRREQRRHVILPIQMASYCVPLLTPHSELGKSVCQEDHESNHGESAASIQARANRYWHHHSAAMTYF